MKLKTTNLKMLLLALGMMLGANASWAQTTTTLLEYGTAEVAWTNENLATWTAGGSPTLSDGIVTISGKDGSYSTSKTISPTSGTIINLTAVWRGSSSTGRYFSEKNGSYFRFGNIVVAQNDQDKKHGYILTGLDNISSVTKFDAGSYRVAIASCTWLKIEAEINTATNTLTSFTVKSEDGATTYVNLSDQTLADPDYTTVAFGYKRTGSVITDNTEQLKSIKITQTTQTVSYANYTVHFKDNNGATVKDDAVRNGVVGSTVHANSADQTTFYSGDYKYVYDNDGDGVEVVAGGTAEMTITYDKKGKYTATASAVSGGSTLQSNIASVTAYEGESATIQLNKFIKVGDVWYSTSTCYVNVTEAGDNEVTYTATDIDYFYEFESLSGGRTDETNKSYSGGIRSRVNKSSSLTTPEEIIGGEYTLTVPYDNSNSTAGKLYLYTVAGGVETDTELTIDAPKGTGTVTKTVTIPDDGALRFKNTNTGYADNGRIDYITISRTKVAYRVEYKCGGTTIKTADDTRTAAWGTYVALTDADKESVTFEGKRYSYTSDNASTTAIASGGTSVITVNFECIGTVATVSYTLNVGAGSQTTITSENTSSTTSLTSLVGVTNNTGGSYGDGGGKADLTVKIPTQTSYDAAKYLSVGFTVGSAYQFTPTSISVKAQPVTTNKTVKLVLTDGVNSIEKTQADLAAGTITTVTLTNDEETSFTGDVTLKIYCYGADDTYRLGSPITIEGAVDYSDAIISITDAGAATLVSPYALDFTGIESVKAYYASAREGANVTFTRIEGTVAANTPLYVTGTTTSVPVVETGDAVGGTNYLVAGTGVAVASEAGGNYNFILNKVGDEVGFYKAANQTVAVGKAYLSLPSDPFANGAKSLNLIFDGETTGISDITRLNGNGESMNDMPIYNLSGQRIAAPQKGINIVNGKKFIVK